MADNRKFLPEISIVIIVGIVLIILAAGISYFIATQFADTGNDEEVAEENGEEVPDIGETYALDEFTTNLSNDGRRMLQVEVILELAEGTSTSQIEERRTPIRDSIISIIRGQTLEELDSDEGYKEFKEDIKDAVNQYIDEGEVLNVYFDSFIIT